MEHVQEPFGTVGTTKAKGRYWHGHDKSHEWHGQSRHNDWSTPMEKAENTGAVSTAVVKPWTATGGRSQMVHNQKMRYNSARRARSSVQRQECEMHREKNHQEGWVQGRFKNVQRMLHQEMCVNSENKHQAFGMLDTLRDEDDRENAAFERRRDARIQTRRDMNRLQETGHDVTTTKKLPLIVNMRTGEGTPLTRERGVFILDMWTWVPTSRSRAESCSGVARQR